MALSCTHAGSCTGTNPYAPGETADVGLRTTWTSQSANFAYGYISSFLPPDWKVTPGDKLTLGSQGGLLTSDATLGMVNGQCNTDLNLPFELFVATTDTSKTFQMAADRNNIDDKDCTGDPGQTLQNHIACYPHFNNIMFDPDGKGPKPALKPRARLSGWTWVGSSMVIIQYFIFDPGQLQAFDPPQAMSQFGPEFGYPAIIVLQNPSEPEMPNPVTNFCTPTITVSDMWGKNAAGETQFQNPPAGTGLRDATGTGTNTHLFLSWSATGRDITAFGEAGDPTGLIQADVTENKIDTCTLQQSSDDSRIWTGADGDMIDPVCDDGRNGGDVDNDLFQNSNDNCPLRTNAFPQVETEWTVMPPPADGGVFQDSLGDVCEVTATSSWSGGDWNGDTDTTDPYEQYLNKYYSQGAYMATLTPWPVPLDTNLTGGWPTNDTDKDGWTNAAETFYGSNLNLNGSGDQDGDTILNVAGLIRCNNGQLTSCSDNCPIDYNPSQADTWGIARIGDVCEQAGPPGFNVTSLHPHGVNDYDADTVLNDADPCPQFDPTGATCPGGGNVVLCDTDVDGIGNLCDPYPTINYAPFGRPEHRVLQFAMPMNDLGAKPLPGEKPKITYLHNFELAGHAPKPQPPLVTPLRMEAGQVEQSGWYELWPYWKRAWTVIGFVDSSIPADGILSTSDKIQVVIDDGIFDPPLQAAAENGWYHVEGVTVTLEVTKHDPGRPDADNKLKRTLELEGATNVVQMDTAIHSPLSTKWLQWDSSFNTHGERYNLSSWIDNGDAMLSLGDDIVLEDLYVTGEKYTYHVTQVGIDATVVKLDAMETPPSLWANPGMNGVEQLCDDYIDNDKDNLVDGDDNCGAQTSDDDNDGLKNTGAGAAKDNCRYAFNPTQNNKDGDASGDACDTDDDGDGLSDAYEYALGSDPLDALSMGGGTSTTDSDGDGFADTLEHHQGVDSTNSCSGATDAWSSDVDANGKVSVGDIIQFSPYLLMECGQSLYNARFDMDANCKVNVGDIININNRGVVLTQCKTLAFTNNSGSVVDDIHVDLTSVWKVRAIAKVWDEDNGAWTCATALPANTIDCVRSSGTLATGKEIFLAIQWDDGSAVDPATSYWTLASVNKGALGTTMDRPSVMLRNDTQGPVNDVHLVLNGTKKVYKVLSIVDSMNTTVLNVAAAAGATKIKVGWAVGFQVGQAIEIGTGETIDKATITAINSITDELTLNPALKFNQPLYAPVVGAWTCTAIPAGGLNVIDCSRAVGKLEYKGILTINWKIDTGASISTANSYWTEGGTNVGLLTIIKMDP
jgi:hypothetical protein